MSLTLSAATQIFEKFVNKNQWKLKELFYVGSFMALAPL